MCLFRLFFWTTCQTSDPNHPSKNLTSLSRFKRNVNTCFAFVNTLFGRDAGRVDIETQEMPRGRPDRIISLYSLRIYCLVTYACTSSIMTTQLPVLNANLQNFLKFSSDKL